MAPLLAGLGLGLSLIVAIGAQNVFLLRQGVRRERVLALVVLFVVSDVVLIAAGVAGLGALVGAVPWFVDVARWAGAAFVAVYGLMAAKRAIRPSGEALDAGEGLEAEAGAHPAAPAGGTPAGSAAGAASPSGAAEGAGPEPAATVVAGAAPAAATATAVRAGAPAPRLAAPGAGVLLSGLALTWLNPHVYLDTVVLLGSIAATYGEARWLFALGAALGSALWFAALGFGARHLGRLLRSPRAWRVLDGVIALTMLAIAAKLAFGA